MPFDRLPRAQAGELFGRAAQLDDLVQRLRRQEHACVWGPAGFGKTALAAEALLHVIGDQEEDLATSPFPDGVVLLDLYRLKANAEQVWHLLADKFAPEIPAELPADQRARQACKGRHALVVVESAEEANDGQTLRNLLAVLDPQTTQLILTRNKAQTYHRSPIWLDAELKSEDAIALLIKLTEDKVDRGILRGVVEAVGGHPLALTWSGCQLALAEEPPARFLEEMQQGRLPRLHEPGYEDHTVKWLYARSARMLSEDARQVLCAAGLLAAAPFGLGAAIAALDRRAEAGEGNSEERAYEALRQLVRHALLRVAADGESWDFTHALGARFAREESAAAPVHLEALCAWARTALEQGRASMQQTGEFAALRNGLLHAVTLLAHDTSAKAGERLSNWLRHDAQDLFFALGRLASAREALSAVEAWMQGAPEPRRAEPAWQREFSALLTRKGDVQLAQGDLAGARESYEQSREIFAKLAAGDPTNGGWQRDLSVSLNKLGDVQLAQGDLAEARESYEQGRTIRAKLAAGDPTNAQWQRDLSVSLEKLGNVQLAQGDLAGARESYAQRHAIAAKLAAGDPTNAEWQRDLSVSLNKLGDVQLAQGDLAGAQESYEQSRTIRAKLAAGDPTNAQWQRDLSVSLDRVGNVQLAQGDLAGARESYEQGRTIRAKLAAGDPTNAEWQRDLSVSLERLGNVQLAQSDLAGAQESYEQSRTIRAKLAAGDPTNAQWQRDLVVSHVKLGEVAARAGDSGLARREYTAGLALAERLCRLDPTNTTWRNDAAWLRQQLEQLPPS